MKKLAKKSLEAGAGVAVGGGLIYGMYELVMFIKYKSWKKKNAASALTFAQYKSQKPA
jgi:hypothetical protein